MKQSNCLIIGSQNSGKTTLLNELKSKGLNIFNADDFVHNNLYLKDQKGYCFIKRHYGEEFVNDIKVDRLKLKLFLQKSNKLNELTHFVNFFINQKILNFNKQAVFIELPTYFDYQEDFNFKVNAFIFLKNKNKNESIFKLNKFDKIYSLIEKYFNDSNVVCFYYFDDKSKWLPISLNELILLINNKEY